VAVLEIYIDAIHDLLALAAAGYSRGGGEGGSSGGGGGKAPGPDELAKCTVDVSGLGAGELPTGMDRWGKMVGCGCEEAVQFHLVTLCVWRLHACRCLATPVAAAHACRHER
jgi:hypothetical protein